MGEYVSVSFTAMMGLSLQQFLVEHESSNRDLQGLLAIVQQVTGTPPDRSVPPQTSPNCHFTGMVLDDLWNRIEHIIAYYASMTQTFGNFVRSLGMANAFSPITSNNDNDNIASDNKNNASNNVDNKINKNASNNKRNVNGNNGNSSDNESNGNGNDCRKSSDVSSDASDNDGKASDNGGNGKGDDNSGNGKDNDDNVGGSNSNGVNDAPTGGPSHNTPSNAMTVAQCAVELAQIIRLFLTDRYPIVRELQNMLSEIFATYPAEMGSVDPMPWLQPEQDEPSLTGTQPERDEPSPLGDAAMLDINELFWKVSQNIDEVWLSIQGFRRFYEPFSSSGIVYRPVATRPFLLPPPPPSSPPAVAYPLLMVPTPIWMHQNGLCCFPVDQLPPPLQPFYGAPVYVDEPHWEDMPQHQVQVVQPAYPDYPHWQLSRFPNGIQDHCCLCVCANATRNGNRSPETPPTGSPLLD